MMGDPRGLHKIRLGDQVTVADFLKELGRASPLEVLQLCFGKKDFDVSEYAIQHADDLDFVQDTLTTTGSSVELNPVLNGVLAGFNRRRRHNRFKYGHCNLELDRLRFASTASPKDSDLCASEVVSHKGSQNEGNTSSRRTRYQLLCNYFQ